MTTLLSIGRYNPYLIIFFLILILLVAFPFLLLGKKRKSLYPYNEKISKKIRDLLMTVHFIGSIIFAVIFTKWLQHYAPYFAQIFEQNNKLIPLTCIVLIITNSIMIGILIEIFTRKTYKH